MIRSMTAYARTSTDTTLGTVTWELRTVNNRYLDQTVRLPDELRGLDGQIRERIAARLRRGKVDCTARLQPGPADSTHITVNDDLVGEIARACQQVGTSLHNPAAVSPLEVLRWPGVLHGDVPDLESAAGPVLQSLDAALDELVATREREGGRLEQMLVERCVQVEAIVSEARVRMPILLDAVRERIRSRLEEIQADLDPTRLEQEMVLFAHKADVAEELDRLTAHVQEVRHVLSRNEPTGRRLDFLMQELNREANTLGSKSTDTSTTRASVDLKVLIEQMREQIQNIE